MTRRSKIWLLLAVSFLLVNLGGVLAAVAEGELLHAGAHAVLLVLGAYLALRFAHRRNARRVWAGRASEISFPGDLTDRLTRLEQSLDAVAIEVERMGEGQRFMTRLFAEKGIPRTPAVGASAPLGNEARDAAR
jgi:hypothetical protein